MRLHIFIPLIFLFSFIPINGEGEEECTDHSKVGFHIHPKIEIYIKGSKVYIPKDIGFSHDCMRPVHTHADDGVIHVEGSKEPRKFYLSEFFQNWKDTYSTAKVLGEDREVIFNKKNIFGYEANNEWEILMVIDGKVNYDYGNLELNELDGKNIKIYYKKRGEITWEIFWELYWWTIPITIIGTIVVAGVSYKLYKRFHKVVKTTRNGRVLCSYCKSYIKPKKLSEHVKKIHGK